VRTGGRDAFVLVENLGRGTQHLLQAVARHSGLGRHSAIDLAHFLGESRSSARPTFPVQQGPREDGSHLLRESPDCHPPSGGSGGGHVGDDVVPVGRDLGAQRELQEETGYIAREWRELPTFYPCIGYSNERLVYFLAQGLEFSGENMDEDEFLEILRVPFAEAMSMVGDGRINEAKTVMGLLWFERFGGKL
jgi:hypothetical protein